MESVVIGSACAPPQLRLRYLQESDVEAVKSLCAEAFPIDYPEYWYSEIAVNPGYYSLAAVWPEAPGGKEALVGLLVAEVKRLSVASAEDRDMLAKSFPANTPVVYILSLAVAKDWRRLGVASKLLDHLLAYLSNGVSEAKAAYLHVLCENAAAIRFYERRGFRRHKRLRAYYQIRSVPRDGFAYVLYLNGGRAPESGLAWLIRAPFRLSLAVLACPLRALLGLCRRPAKLYTRARLCLLHPDHAQITY